MVMAAHNIPYVAQSAPFRNMRDLYEKAEKAIYTPGPAFLNVMAPCPRGWRYNTPQLMEVVRLAIDSCVWPLYEVIEGKFVLNYKPRKKIPVVDYLKPQGRFRHLFTKENEGLLEELQQEVDRRWNRLLELCGEA